MASSKFSSPFFQKSPLQGAYAAGADGMVTVSYADIHKDFQQGIADNVSKAYTKEKSPCDDLEQKLSENKITTTAYETLTKKCNKNKNQNQDLKNNVTQTLNNLPKPGTKEFDINSMQADGFGGFGSNSTNEKGTVS
tara:strand:- start:56 stop:466 length:411 start_codon:yes stop_codon:yes gene_type:complete